MKSKKLSPKKSKAQAMVEFAIALPVLLLLLYGMLETGRFLFLYTTVVTASRQAVRYGSATGEGTSPAIPRYDDCNGIRTAAKNYAFLGPFTDANILIYHDSGPADPQGKQAYCPAGTPSSSWAPTDNNQRISVTVSKQFTPLLKLVPFNPTNVTATSSRTILNSVAIVVQQPPQIVVQDPTTTEIDFDNPDPSALNQSVTVQVTVTDTVDSTKTPTGTVEVSAQDGAVIISCTITLNSSGWGSCLLVFTSSGQTSITATYSGDDQHLSSTSDPEPHMVQLTPTVTRIVSDSPDPSLKNQDVIVSVTVTGGSIPTGTVNIDAGGSDKCTITLAGGAGSCTLNFGNLGTKTITATYNGDSTHAVSPTVSVPHEVLAGTPTPTLSPTATLIPTITSTPTLTPIPTVTNTPTAIASPVSSCSAVTHGPITKSGNTMSMTITNNESFPLTTGTGYVVWNDDKGHQHGSDKTLKLQSITIAGTAVWTGNSSSVSSMTFINPAVIPAGPNTTVVVTLTFQQSYDNLDGTEYIYINLSTPGCANNAIHS